MSATMCQKGLHDLTDSANVFVQPSNGARTCRACKAEYQRRYRAGLKAKAGAAR